MLNDEKKEIVFSPQEVGDYLYVFVNSTDEKKSKYTGICLNP